MLTIKEITEKIMPILNNNDVERAILFGSHARNEANAESDVDLVVDTKKTGLDFIQIMLEIQDVLGKNVDLIPQRSVDKSHKIYQSILHEGVVVYEQN